MKTILRRVVPLVVGLLAPAAAHADLFGSNPPGISSAAVTAMFGAPPPIGNVTPNSGAFTSLSAISTISTPAGNLLFGAYLAQTAAPTSGGTGYVAGNLLTCVGGTFTTACVVSVDHVTAGVIDAYHVALQGSYTVNPASVTVTGGAGTGATFALSFGPLAAGVQQAGLVPNSVNGPTNFGGSGAGLNMRSAALGNTFGGFYSAGGGVNTGDGLGGGTGFTAGEITALGWAACSQMTTDTYPFCMGTNALGHENGGQKETAVGTDAAKWVVNGQLAEFFGFGAGAFLQNPARVMAMGNQAAQGVQVIATASGAASGAGNVIRLTVSTTGMATGDKAVVTNCNGTVPANGVWSNVTVVDGTHLDLTGSTFSGASTTSCGVTDFGSVKLADSVIIGPLALSGSTMRSAGVITSIGASNLTGLDTGAFITAVGSFIAPNLKGGTQHFFGGWNIGSTAVNSFGLVLIGHQSDVVGANDSDAVGIGGAGNGGGAGGITSNQSVVIGGRTNNRNIGTNMLALGYQAGAGCSGGGAVIILTTSGGGCTAAGEVNTAHFSNGSGDIFSWSGGGVPSTSLATFSGSVTSSGFSLTNVKFVSGTAPTYASGGCSTQSAVTSNGTAAFSITMTGVCAASQPIVFTLPAAAHSWACTARDVTTATSAPKQTGAQSTTSVTVTNFGITSGLAIAWAANDVVETECLGY